MEPRLLEYALDWVRHSRRTLERVRDGFCAEFAADRPVLHPTEVYMKIQRLKLEGRLVFYEQFTTNEWSIPEKPNWGPALGGAGPDI